MSGGGLRMIILVIAAKVVAVTVLVVAITEEVVVNLVVPVTKGSRVVRNVQKNLKKL